MSLLCLISGTPLDTATCGAVADGILASSIYIANKAEITLGARTDTTFSTFTIASGGKQLYKFEILEDDGDIKSTVVAGPRGSNTLTQEFSCVVNKINEDSRKFLTELLNGRFVIFVVTKAQEILVIGYEDGAKLVDGTEFGVAEDTFGASLVFQTLKNIEVTPAYLDTDYATSLAALEAALTPTA